MEPRSLVELVVTWPGRLVSSRSGSWLRVRRPALGFFDRIPPPLVVPVVLADAWLFVASVILATHAWTTAS
jgi:hypothetical protein